MDTMRDNKSRRKNAGNKIRRTEKQDVTARAHPVQILANGLLVCGLQPALDLVAGW
jgi:hypothetical protein